jgi:hypothetical protein
MNISHENKETVKGGCDDHITKFRHRIDRFNKILTLHSHIIERNKIPQNKIPSIDSTLYSRCRDVKYCVVRLKISQTSLKSLIGIHLYYS